MSTMLRIERPPASPATAPRFALWRLGFRPFYLLGSGFAALSIGLWALQFSGALTYPQLQMAARRAH